MKVFRMFANDKAYGNEIIASKMKDLKEDYINPDKAFYSDMKITCKQVGILVVLNGIHKKVMFDNSPQFNKELKGLTQLQLIALLTGDFTNDNNSFYLLEKGLLLPDRASLSDKGIEFINRVGINSTIQL